MPSSPDDYELTEKDLTSSATTVYRFLRRWSGDAMLAEECTQETVLRVWANRSEFRSPKQLTVWMLTTARRIVIDQARTRTRERRESIDPELLVAVDATPTERLALREEARRAMTAMDRLPARQRAIAFLHFVEQFPITEIAEMLELATATVRSNLSVAREKLRAQFQDSGAGAAEDRR